MQGLLLLLGTPGLDFLTHDALTTDAQKATMRRRVGGVGLAIGEVIARFNRSVRVPIASALEPLQYPFHIQQLWALYRDGPNKMRRAQVSVNGQLVYRTLDPEDRWLEPQFRHRRIRPLLEEMCLDEKSRHSRDLVKWIAERARTDFENVHEVKVECTASPFPGDSEAVHHGFVVAEPDWVPRPL